MWLSAKRSSLSASDVSSIVTVPEEGCRWFKFLELAGIIIHLSVDVNEAMPSCGLHKQVAFQLHFECLDCMSFSWDSCERQVLILGLTTLLLFRKCSAVD